MVILVRRNASFPRSIVHRKGAFVSRFSGSRSWACWLENGEALAKRSTSGCGEEQRSAQPRFRGERTHQCETLDGRTAGNRERLAERTGQVAGVNSALKSAGWQIVDQSHAANWGGNNGIGSAGLDQGQHSIDDRCHRNGRVGPQCGAGVPTALRNCSWIPCAIKGPAKVLDAGAHVDRGGGGGFPK